MKGKKIFFCILFLTAVMTTGAAAVNTEDNVIASQAEAVGADELKGVLPDQASDYLDGMDVMDSLDLGTGVNRLLQNASTDLGSFLKKGLLSAMMLLCAVLLTGIVENIHDASRNAAVRYIPLIGAIAVAAISTTDLNSLIGLGRTAIEDMNIFSKTLLPTLAAAASASGAAVSSAARHVATAWFADILMSVIQRVLLPLVYAYIALCVADAAFGEGMLSRLAKLIRTATVWCLSILLAAFTAYLSLSGVISGTTDALALRAAKTTISTAVPVVGGIISDAADTLLVGAGVLRNAIGVFGALAIIAICIAPFLQLGAHYIFYKLSAAISSTVGTPSVVKLIDDLAGAFGIILGMTASCGLMLFISIISTVSAVIPS